MQKANGRARRAPLIEGLEAHELPDSRNPALSYLAGLGTRKSRRTMREHLDALALDASGGVLLARDFPWHSLRFEHTSRMRAAMLDRLGTATVNQRLAGLRQVLRQAWRLELMTAEELARAGDLERVRGSGALRGRALGHSELQRLVAACLSGSAPAHAARDAALVAVLFGCALRRAEAACLDLSDCGQEEHNLQVKGKGRRARTVPMTRSVSERIAEWLRHRGRDPGPLFRAVSRTGKVLERRLGAAGVYDVVSKRAEIAGLGSVSPHDLRRSAATALLEEGTDLNTVRRALGHSKLETTGRYDHRSEAEVAGALMGLGSWLDPG